MEVLGKIWRILVDSMQGLLIFAAFLLVLYMFVIRPFQVNGMSMYPNFKDGEWVLTSLVELYFHKIRLGDVVVLRANAAHEGDHDFIKRVIGVPGDTLFLHGGKVYLNGNVLDQGSFLKSDVTTYGGAFLQEDGSAIVPSDSYFVMGDNRPYSSDSREWGFVKKEDIIGFSSVVFWPLSDLKVVRNPVK